MNKRQTHDMNPRETHPPLTAKKFEATPEFRDFKHIMRRLLTVAKPQLDRRVRSAKKRSPRFGNPSAPGRKPKSVGN